jgi:hypothetical protein
VGCSEDCNKQTVRSFLTRLRNISFYRDFYIDFYESNSEIHYISTRFSSDLHTPTANLTTFQKGPFYFGIKVFTHLATSITTASNDINQFRSVLKSFLLVHSFYSEEYFTWNSNRYLGSV